MKSNLWVLSVLTLAFGAMGCSSVLIAHRATETFMEERSCPKDRIQMIYVPIQPRDVFEGDTPPADVAADPGRLKIWTKHANDDFGSLGGLTLVEATGCGARRTYFCWEEDRNDKRFIYCSPVDLDTPNARISIFRLKASAGESLKQRLRAGK
jgi:hypothetical protein